MNVKTTADVAWRVVPAEGSLTRGQTSPVGRLAPIGLAIVLVLLLAFALLSALLTYQVGSAAKQASSLSDIFNGARYDVGAEESLERKYRLEPSPEVRGRHATAASSLVSALGQAHDLGDAADRALVDSVLTTHRQYLSAIEHMFAAVDAGNIELATKIDGEEVDPSFADIETRIDGAANTHRALAENNLNKLATVQASVLIATPIVFIVGLGLLVLFWRALQAYRKQAILAMTNETAAIARRERRFRALVHSSSDVVMICAADGIITYEGPTAQSAWGYAVGALLDTPIAELVHPDDHAAWRDFFGQLCGSPGATRSAELRLRNAGGVWAESEVTLTNMLADPAVLGLVATARDVTERKAFETQLTRQALYDSLTLLPNRVLLRDRIEQTLSRASRLKTKIGVLFLDLDNFKAINDSLGHRVGDELLTQAATRLRSCVREESTVARLGGDEFVILLEHVSSEVDAVLVAERVEKQFSKPFKLAGREFVVTTSIGIALSDAGHDAEKIMRDADIAMYSAKGRGKAQHIVFNASMQTDTLARLVLENDLRHAIERHELRLHYQPIVRLDTGEVTEVEALLRWEHPTRGLLAPMVFIPLAEETGLIVTIGGWVLNEACRQVAAWQADFPRDPPLTVSVNLSPRQFQQPNLVQQVGQTLRETGLDARSLKLEITEGTIMRDVETTAAALSGLKALGVQLAVDDFGTGYSSLSYLSRLPLDILKIDRSFVKGIDRGGEDTAIVRAIISMAKSLHLSVTGEGIETAEQAALLRKWACDLGQGFYYSRPLEAASLEALLGKIVLPRDQEEVA
ncbi:EAL domain-containing protein [Pseudolabrys sp. Root1462]|uniref:putative bifunctional diguanylate cyclase/phosphodiesterase n=1 Tax=Pseudolabrys sp. Root1462 TaxID=1736466 RepID=UPI000B0E21B7|nr:EAL domain-containing protein [Pseudolabrys sp. Root1462]